MTQMQGAMRMVGVTARCDDGCPEKIAALWQRFWQEEVMSKSGGSGMYAVYYDYAHGHTGEYTVLIGSQIQPGTPRANGLCECTVRAGLYEQVDGPGDGDADVSVMWKTIRASHLDRTFLTDYEDYGSEGSAVIYVGINAPAQPHPPAHGGTSPAHTP